MRRYIVVAIGLLAALGNIGSTDAREVRAAVAGNFTAAAQDIGAAFEAATGHSVIFSFGSTGQLFAQITQGAPFDVFLAADRARPQKAIDDGWAVADSLFTYAAGRIVLFSAIPGLVLTDNTLREMAFERIAMANPLTAPYGVASVEAMQSLGVYDALAGKIVRGSNVGQTYQFVVTGNAEVGFVALSQVIDSSVGSYWLVPEDMHGVIAQDAVLLTASADNEAAIAFLDFLRGPEASAIKKTYGYTAGDEDRR